MHQMSITITIESGSKAAKAIANHMADKKAFANAVKTGTVMEYIKNNKAKFATPVPAKR